MARRLMGLAFVVVSAVVPVGAQEVERDAARQRYAEGQELFRAGDYEAALEAFRAAYQAAPHPIPVKSQAECHERLGNLAEAVALFERYLEFRPDAADAQAIRARIDSLRGQLGALRVTSYPGGARVHVDGQLLRSATPLEVNVIPGPHTIRIELPGYRVTTQELTTVAGGDHVLHFNLERPPPPAPATTEGPAGEEPPDEDQRILLSPPFWTMVAVTAAGAIAATVAGSLALASQAEFDDGVAAGRNRNELKELGERGQTQAIIADVGWALAGAGALAATILFIVQNKDHLATSHRRPTLAWSPTTMRLGAGLRLEGQF
jgi:tetratricopeptide (TPR) repeat protein